MSGKMMKTSCPFQRSIDNKFSKRNNHVCHRILDQVVLHNFPQYMWAILIKSWISFQTDGRCTIFQCLLIFNQELKNYSIHYFKILNVTYTLYIIYVFLQMDQLLKENRKTKMNWRMSLLNQAFVTYNFNQQDLILKWQKILMTWKLSFNK